MNAQLKIRKTYEQTLEEAKEFFELNRPLLNGKVIDKELVRYRKYLNSNKEKDLFKREMTAWLNEFIKTQFI